jgi:hypothetical protein
LETTKEEMEGQLREGCKLSNSGMEDRKEIILMTVLERGINKLRKV